MKKIDPVEMMFIGALAVLICGMGVLTFLFVEYLPRKNNLTHEQRFEVAAKSCDEMKGELSAYGGYYWCRAERIHNNEKISILYDLGKI